MAEIKSTLELVMERAARMSKASNDELQQEDERRLGMKLAADFLDDKADSLSAALAEQPGEQQMTIRCGMVETLLRNIFLYRDELGKERTDKAVNGLLEISGNAGDVCSICSELQHILGQYNQHRDQLRQQLEDQIRMQYEHVLAQQAAELQASGVNPEHALAAKVNEELGRMETELSDRYNEALEQHKENIRARLR
ncbi:MAG: hypothetical protein ACL93V_08065 [Candidatus Electrothrix sp. YB6]